MGDHLAVSNWPHDGKFYAPGFYVGSEDDDGTHRRDRDGWPYSVYRRACTIGGTDAVVCHGIQHPVDADRICNLLNAAAPIEAWAAHARECEDAAMAALSERETSNAA